MADKKITQLSATTSANGDDLATTVINVSTTPTNLKITIANLLKQIFLAAGTKLSFTTIADGEFLKRVGTDITGGAVAPTGATYITQTPDATLTNEQAMGSLATGLVKNTTATGVQSIAAPATDYVAPGPVTSSGLTQSTARLLGRTTAATGAIEEISAGTGITLAGGTISSSGGASSVPSTVQGDMLYASGVDTLAALAKDTNATRYLSNTGASNNPAWAQVALSTGISGLGANVATFLATPSSANLASALTDETGTGVAVFGTGPSLVSPLISMTAAHGADDTYTGLTISGLNAGTTIAQWETVCLGVSSTWLLADANGSGTYPARGLAVAAYVNTDPAIVLTYGTVRNDAWNWTPGEPIYLSTSAGGLTQTAPSTSGDQVQQVGFALTADIAFFDFNSTYLTVD